MTVKVYSGTWEYRAVSSQKFSFTSLWWAGRETVQNSQDAL